MSIFSPSLSFVQTADTRNRSVTGANLRGLFPVLPGAPFQTWEVMRTNLNDMFSKTPDPEQFQKIKTQKTVEVLQSEYTDLTTLLNQNKIADLTRSDFSDEQILMILNLDEFSTYKNTFLSYSQYYQVLKSKLHNREEVFNTLSFKDAEIYYNEYTELPPLLQKTDFSQSESAVFTQFQALLILECAQFSKHRDDFISYENRVRSTNINNPENHNSGENTSKESFYKKSHATSKVFSFIVSTVLSATMGVIGIGVTSVVNEAEAARGKLVTMEQHVIRELKNGMRQGLDMDDILSQLIKKPAEQRALLHYYEKTGKNPQWILASNSFKGTTQKVQKPTVQKNRVTPVRDRSAITLEEKLNSKTIPFHKLGLTVPQLQLIAAGKIGTTTQHGYAKKTLRDRGINITSAAPEIRKKPVTRLAHTPRQHNTSTHSVEKYSPEYGTMKNRTLKIANNSGKSMQYLVQKNEYTDQDIRFIFEHGASWLVKGARKALKKTPQRRYLLKFYKGNSSSKNRNNKNTKPLPKFSSPRAVSPKKRITDVLDSQDFIRELRPGEKGGTMYRLLPGETQPLCNYNDNCIGSAGVNLHRLLLASPFHIAATHQNSKQKAGTIAEWTLSDGTILNVAYLDFKDNRFDESNKPYDLLIRKDEKAHDFIISKIRVLGHISVHQARDLYNR